MPRITISLDDDAKSRLDQAAASRGLSRSRWVAGIIQAHLSQEWPQGWKTLAGSFADFPLRVEDVPEVREPSERTRDAGS